MKLLKEPLLHFLLLGALIFGISAWREPRPPAVDPAKRIEVTAGMIASLREGYTKQWQWAPDADEMRGLVNDHVREEVLYREALALGLDRNDTIVRRRLAQKMEFLGQDLIALGKPDDVTLRKFFEANAARYATAPQVGFTHIYFSKDKRGAGMETDASEALAALAKGAASDGLGDTFLGGHDFTALAESDIAAILGSEFAAGVVALPKDQWQGPVASSYGSHLVRVTERTEPQAVEYEAVAEAVLRDFSEERRLAGNSDFIRRLKERYEIKVDEAAIDRAASPPRKTAIR